MSEEVKQVTPKQGNIEIPLAGLALQAYKECCEYVAQKLEGVDEEEVKNLTPVEYVEMVLTFGDDYFEPRMKELDPKSNEAINYRISAATFYNNLTERIVKVHEETDTIEKA